jgi:hypothetical protein
MFWIYIPPVVLVGAIIALVVVLGRKSAELRKAGGLHARQSARSFPISKKDRWKRAGQQILRILERILISIKFAVKKSEQSIAKLVFRIRVRRGEKKPLEDSRIEDLVRGRVEEPETTEWIASEVVVKKKRAEEPVVRLKEMPVAEDKVKEEALIHRIAENPKDVEAYRELGDYYLSTGNIKDAKDSFKMVLKLRPRDLKAKSSLREIEMKMRLGS